MSIERTDIKYYKSLTYNDTVSNGGRRSNTLLLSGSSNQMFPVITSAERAAGSLKYRKIFVQIESVQNLPLIDPKIYIENPTPAQDMVFFFPGTKSDIQSGITGTERKYGCGVLETSVVAGGTTLVVQTESSTVDIFQDGDLVRISNKSNIDDTTAQVTEEVVLVTGTPLRQGSIITIPIAPLTFDYTSGISRVSSVYQPGTLAPSIENLLVTSSSGIYNSSDHPISLYSKATIDQTWTVRFLSASQVSVTGDSVGALGTFSATSDIAPINPQTSSPYFRIPVTGLSGSFTLNDLISFKSNSQSVGLWFQRIVPAGTASFTGNKFVVVVEGESE